jgi:hypothetical protein
VPALAFRLVPENDPGTAVNDGRFLDDEAVTFQTDDVPTAVRQGDFIRLVRIQPDLALAAFQNGRR